MYWIVGIVGCHDSLIHRFGSSTCCTADVAVGGGGGGGRGGGVIVIKIQHGVQSRSD